ncbi:MAG: hypothetical protein JRF31_02555 [Deltaproteobacteria bacterium]|nr:hypothetical protein [Deltaproteobacteria bacterium]MBW1958284.1 hypothetical protein [Deltaproteobacteria bacterium]MBW2088028.1 hypothetical protein [Deltaproteobacteria bacterium]MBW2319738.1 hypothetical protein [Deltaproteobacteria bacterium]
MSTAGFEEAPENFAGCAVVISHDRWFLDGIATHILTFEGDSRAIWKITIKKIRIIVYF